MMKYIRAKTFTVEHDYAQYKPVDISEQQEPQQLPNKGRFSKLILKSMFIFLMVFTMAVLYVSYKTGSEPSTLVTCVFAFCGAEGGCLAWIKTIKSKNGGNNDA